MSIDFEAITPSFPRLCPGSLELDSPSNFVEPILEPVLSSFERATGWVLSCVPLEYAGRNSRLFVSDMSSSNTSRPTERRNAEQLCAAMSAIWCELQTARRKIAAHNAHEASQSNIRFGKEKSSRLAETLAMLLKSACEFLGGGKAGLYLLDEDTRCLDLRSQFGWVGSENNESRMLAECPSDLEAISGHAIVALDENEVKDFACPFSAKSAVCLPVASTSNILGTMWVGCGERDDFCDSELNVLEIVAGRMAAEIEKEAVLRQLAGKERC